MKQDSDSYITTLFIVSTEESERKVCGKNIYLIFTDQKADAQRLNYIYEVNENINRTVMSQICIPQKV